MCHSRQWAQYVTVTGAQPGWAGDFTVSVCVAASHFQLSDGAQPSPTLTREGADVTPRNFTVHSREATWPRNPPHEGATVPVCAPRRSEYVTRVVELRAEEVPSSSYSVKEPDAPGATVTVSRFSGFWTSFATSAVRVTATLPARRNTGMVPRSVVTCCVVPPG